MNGSEIGIFFGAEQDSSSSIMGLPGKWLKSVSFVRIIDIEYTEIRSRTILARGQMCLWTGDIFTMRCEKLCPCFVSKTGYVIINRQVNPMSRIRSCLTSQDNAVNSLQNSETITRQGRCFEPPKAMQ